MPDGHPVLTDDAISRLVDDFVQAARQAQRAGFDFVDVKHCHGYLGHEFLSAVDRPGRYGGDFDNRTRFLREIVAGVRAEAPGLAIGVRLSAIDWVPFRKGPDGRGEPEPIEGAYRHAFGGDGSGVGADLTEPYRFLELLASLDIRLMCMSIGSPYYNPHYPAASPVPAVGRLSAAGRPAGRRGPADRRRGGPERHRPALAIVGSGYSYLQEWLPNVGQAVVRTGGADFIGLRTDGAELPRDARRRAGGSAAATASRFAALSATAPRPREMALSRGATPSIRSTSPARTRSAWPRSSATPRRSHSQADERRRHQESVLLVQAPDAVPAGVLAEEDDQYVERDRGQQRQSAGPAEEPVSRRQPARPAPTPIPSADGSGK